MEIENLEKDFGGFINKEIPSLKKVEKSLITILKANSETNLSNLLAHCFDGDGDPLLRQVFVDAFLSELPDEIPDNISDLIGENHNNLEVEVEYPTRLGNKIDIVLKFKNKRKSEMCAIIIENKLFHVLNNDLEEYFYSVSDLEKIETKNILVVVLSLKQSKDTLPDTRRHVQLTHSQLKEAVKKEHGRSLSQINNRFTQLIFDEYFKHIDDLYLENSNYENELGINYFIQNREQIIKLINIFKTINENNYKDLSERDKYFLFKSKDKIDQLIALRDGLYKLASLSFHKFLELTDRKVRGGNSENYYFRAQGSAYDAIRYKLNFDDYFFNNEKLIGLKIYLNQTFLTQNGIVLKTHELVEIIKKHEVKLPENIGNVEWVELVIKNDSLVCDETIFNNIFKEILTKQYGKFEEEISELLNLKFTNQFYNNLTQFLSQYGYKIRKNDEEVNLWYFKKDLKEIITQFSIKYIAPDYFEIMLHVNYSIWDKVYAKVKDTKKYLVFDEKHSHSIPEIRDESVLDYNCNYDAILKKSYRIKDLDPANSDLQIDITEWMSMENEIIAIIEKHKKLKII
jgi:hypothetical protein